MTKPSARSDGHRCNEQMKGCKNSPWGNFDSLTNVTPCRPMDATGPPLLSPLPSRCTQKAPLFFTMQFFDLEPRSRSHTASPSSMVASPSSVARSLAKNSHKWSLRERRIRSGLVRDSHRQIINLETQLGLNKIAKKIGEMIPYWGF